MQINLLPVPAFNDNYIWLWSVPGSRAAWAVDPADAAPLQAALREQDRVLAGVLVTHHHFDHVGGIAELVKAQPVPVYGPANSPAASQFTHPVSGGQTLTLDGLAWQVLAVPGHTLDHVAYYSPQAGILFCGDTLFAAGCGRVFEGTMAQMHDSLQVLAALPDDTRVCCAHEYTLSNLRFALAAEPENPAIRDRNAKVSALREQGLPSLPSTLAEERATNPFLRAESAARFETLRSWKDRF